MEKQKDDADVYPHYVLVTYDDPKAKTNRTVIGTDFYYNYKTNVETDGVWSVSVPYTGIVGTKNTKDTIKVTPLYVSTEDNSVVYTGKTGSTTYNRTLFTEAAWKTAPAVEGNPCIKDNKVTILFHLYGGATDAVMKIDGKYYGKLSELPLNTADDANEAEIVVHKYSGDDYEWGITVTYGKTFAYGTHKFAFAAVSPSNADNYSSIFSKETPVTISATPSWVNSKITVKAAQKDDTTITLTYTNLADDNNSIDSYQISLDGKTWVDIPETRQEEDQSIAELDAKGKNWVYDYVFDEPEYGTKITFQIKAVGANYAGTGTLETKENKIGKATVTMTKLWQTAPSVKVAYDIVDRVATMIVTGKGNPKEYVLSYNTTGKDSSGWTPVFATGSTTA